MKTIRTNGKFRTDKTIFLNDQRSCLFPHEHIVDDLFLYIYTKRSSFMIVLYKNIITDCFSTRTNHCWWLLYTRNISLIIVDEFFVRNITIIDFSISKTLLLLTFQSKEVTVDDFSLTKYRSWCLFYMKSLSLMTYIWKGHFLYQKHYSCLSYNSRWLLFMTFL